MNTQKPATPAETSQLPLPGRQFQRFVLLFHIAFLTGMVLTLPSRWYRSGFSWNILELVLIGLVLSQVVLYIRFFAWPAPEAVQRERWAFYFPVSFALWFITWRAEPAFEWVALGYLGQLFGAVPPRFSIPGAAAVFALYLPAKVGWAGLAQLGIKQWLGYGAMVVVWSALGLFIHRLAVTSAERARLIRDLEAARKALELAGERDTELAVLRERERLARELHDSLGHNLVTLTVQLEAAQRLYPVDPVRASSLMDEMKKLNRTAMEQLRRSLAGLLAAGLGERPLDEAVRELCAETSKRAGIMVECTLPAKFVVFTPTLAEALWRVTQEGLANIERHSHATRSQVVLEIAHDVATTHTTEVRLKIVDNGVGLPPNAEAKAGHFGLRGLRERIEGLGGVFTATTSVGGGSTLEARLPMHVYSKDGGE